VKELLVRALSGAAYVALTIGAAIAGEVTVALLFLPVCLIAAAELHRLWWHGAWAPHAGWAIGLAASTYLGVVAGVFVEGWGIPHLIACCAGVLLLGIMHVLVSPTAMASRLLGAHTLSILLVGVPFAVLVHLRAQDLWLLLGFFVLLWSNDTGAYLVGKTLGRTKLLPAVSPGKTVEGTVGGAVFSMGVAWVLQTQGSGPPWTPWILAGAIVALTGTVGDLLESALKREAGVKDSGALMPGHGGLLDRFDALLLAAPAMALLLALNN
jgi:phosphatidate cytidylyltransferase